VTKKLSLLHVEDDSLWQASLSQALRVLPNVGRVESVATGQDALELAARMSPDLVLLDIVLPDCDGLHLAQDLARLPVRPRILFVTAMRDEFTLFTASQPGVAGLVWKSDGVFGQLGEAVRAAAAGEKYYSPEIRDALRRFRTDPKAFFKMLSPRELAVLERVAQGETDDEIAAHLGLSEHTVRSHRQHIMRKLDMPNAARLIHWAIRHGFGGHQLGNSWQAQEGA
jgi:DNA-binding NarL/FixJ family response regulator